MRIAEQKVVFPLVSYGCESWYLFIIVLTQAEDDQEKFAEEDIWA
jgi:hypothetical protein